MTSSLDKRKESIQKLRSEEFDVLVIGAGITGAGIAWDAAMRGLKVAIIDKEDFSSGTSSGSSKLVHAGIRYLAYGEFGLVRHASRERRWMFKACPHQTEPVPFIIPIYQKGKNTFLKLLFAGIMYDLLACFRNTKNHHFLSKEKTIKKVPKIKKEPLKRSLYYWDGIMDDARVTLEVVLSAREEDALTINYVKAIDFTFDEEEKETVTGIIAEDQLSKDQFSIKAKIIVNASGPWTNKVLALTGDSKKIVVPSKGIHIITKRLIEDDVVLVITAKDKRGMFVIPFRKDYSLIGTTDTFYDGSLNHVDVTQKDVDYVIDAVNSDMPGALTKKDVISAYSGLRPLILSPKAKSETSTSRDFEIFETKTNLLTVTGGKYTIFRYMAKKTVDKIVKKLKLPKRDFNCKTKKAKLFGGKGIKDIKKYKKERIPVICELYEINEKLADHLIQTYGSAHIKILDIIKENPASKEQIASNRPYIVAEVIHAIRNEMCVTLNDFMLRRTQLQLINHQGLDCAEKIAKIMGAELNWDKQEIKSQFTKYKQDLVWNH